MSTTHANDVMFIVPEMQGPTADVGKICGNVGSAGLVHAAQQDRLCSCGHACRLGYPDVARHVGKFTRNRSSVVRCFFFGECGDHE